MIGATFPVTITAMWKGGGQVTRGLLGIEGTAQRTGKAIQNLREDFRGLAGAFTGIMAARFFARTFGAFMKPAADMQQAMTRLKGLTGETQEGLARFRKEALRVAGITPFGPVALTNALLKLRQATGSNKEALEALEATTQVAMATFGDSEASLEQAVKMMGDMIRVFGLTGKQASVAADMVYSAGKTFGLTIDEYEKVMGKLGVAAMRGGQSFGEVVRAFTLVRRAGIGAEQASTGLIRIMGELQKSEGLDAFRSIGVDPIDQATQELRPLSQILLELTSRYRDYGAATKEAIDAAFQERSMKTAIALLSGMANGVRDNEGNLLKAEKANEMLNASMQKLGGLANLSKLYVQDLKAKWTLLNEEWGKTLIELGGGLIPLLSTLVDGLKAFLSVVNTILAIPGVGFLAGLSLAVVGLRLAIVALGGALTGMVDIYRVVRHNLHQRIAAIKTETLAVNENTAAQARNTAAKLAAATPASPALRNFGQAMSSVGRLAHTGQTPVGFMTTEQQSYQMAMTAHNASIYTKINKALGGLKSGLGAVGRAAKTAGSFLFGMFGGLPGIIAMAILAVISYRKEIADLIDSAGKKFEELENRVMSGKGGKASFFDNLLYSMKNMPGYASAFINMLGIFRKATKESMKEAADIAKQKIAKELNEAADKLKESLQIGGDRLGKELDRIEKMVNWTPPVVQTKYINQMRDQLKKGMASGAISDADKRAMGGSIQALDKIDAIREEALKTGQPISPENYRLMANLAKYSTVIGKHLTARYGESVVGKGLNKRFGEHVTSQLVKTGSAENIEASGLVTMGQGGVIPSGEYLPGYKPGVSGYGEKPAGPLERFIGEYFKKSQAEFVEKAAYKEEVRMLKQKMDTFVASMQDIVKTLQGTLTVRTEEEAKGAAAFSGASASGKSW